MPPCCLISCAPIPRHRASNLAVCPSTPLLMQPHSPMHVGGPQARCALSPPLTVLFPSVQTSSFPCLVRAPSPLGACPAAAHAAPHLGARPSTPTSPGLPPIHAQIPFLHSSPSAPLPYGRPQRMPSCSCCPRQHTRLPGTLPIDSLRTALPFTPCSLSASLISFLRVCAGAAPRLVRRRLL